MGGRGSSKSWDAAGFAIFLAQAYKVRFLCARQFQNRIADSVHSLLAATIDRFGLMDQFDILENTIRHKTTGSEFLFYGLWRNINEIKSLEGIDVTWLEEAHALTKEQWEVLEPTVLRKAGSQIWVIFNPQYSTDFVWKNFVANPPAGTLKRQINYDENPFLSENMLTVIDSARQKDADDFNWIYLGQPKDSDNEAIIKRKWIMAAVDAHKKLGLNITGDRRVGFDVADSGSDLCATIYAHGPLIADADMWKGQEDEILRSATRARETCLKHDAHMIYDSIGVGAFVGSHVNSLNSMHEVVRHTAFNAGGPVEKPDAVYAHSHPRKTNKEQFANLKAQKWRAAADRFMNTYNAVEKGMTFDQSDMIFIDSSLPHLDRLIDELSTPRKDYDTLGREKVESKKDLAKSNREGGAMPSPNLADAAIMAVAVGTRSGLNITNNMLRGI